MATYTQTSAGDPSGEEIQALQASLLQENAALMELVTLAIEDAERRGDTALLKDITLVLLKHLRPLLRSREQHESQEEEDHLEHLFDDL